MTDGRDKREMLVAAGALQRVLIAATFGNITAKSRSVTFTDTRS